MSELQLLIWTAYEHDHNPANDTSKHMKVATAKKVKQVIAEAPIGDFIFFIVLHLFGILLLNHSGIRAAHLHQELNLDPVTALSPTKPRRR